MKNHREGSRFHTHTHNSIGMPFGTLSFYYMHSNIYVAVSFASWACMRNGIACEHLPLCLYRGAIIHSHSTEASIEHRVSYTVLQLEWITYGSIHVYDWLLWLPVCGCCHDAFCIGFAHSIAFTLDRLKWLRLCLFHRMSCSHNNFSYVVYVVFSVVFVLFRLFISFFFTVFILRLTCACLLGGCESRR